MAIPCDIPFELLLYGSIDGIKKEQTIKLTPHLEEILNNTQEYCLCIRENTTYELLFDAEDREARLYIEGLEGVENSWYDEKREQYYIFPNSKPFIWFRWDVSGTGLIPGSYYIKVQCDNRMYYGVLKVEPKHLEAYQFQQMRDEVETFLGKWKELPIGVKESIEEKMAQDMSHNEANQLKVLMKWSSRLIPLMYQFNTQLDERIEKVYSHTPKELGRKIDQQAIKMSMCKNISIENHFSYTRTTSYDTKENRWLKHFNEKLLVLTNILRRNRCTLEEKEILGQIHIMCQNLRKSIGYNKIKSENNQELPLRSRYDSRYRLLLECENELWKSKAESYLKAIKDYLWLETSWVYELWCFKEVYEQLKKEGYQSVGTMPSGFILQKEDMILRLHYDTLIPSHSVQTSKKQPLYARSPRHRKPDGRIDFYKKDGYLGSIILEFKYSSHYFVWNEERDTRCSEQLLHYGYQLGSDYLEGEEYERLPESIRTRINPVHKVIVIMPELRNHSLYSEDSETNIVQIALKPGAESSDWGRVIMSLV